MNVLTALNAKWLQCVIAVAILSEREVRVKNTYMVNY